MTKEEAIKNIMEVAYLLVDVEQKKKIYESLETLVTDSAKEDTASEGVLISRQGALALAKDLTFEGGCKHRCIDATAILELPTYSFTQLHFPRKEDTAEWILFDDSNAYECSNCKEGEDTE